MYNVTKKDKFSLFNKKYFVFLALFFLILFAGCVTSNGTIPEEKTTPLSVCSFECCLAGEGYRLKECGSQYQDCIQGSCVQKECVFECCKGDTYKLKQCELHYSCNDNMCVPKDSDQDGLYDYEEVEFGTRLNMKDSDSDGLNDFQEIKIEGTNALNPNTDGDRYKDGYDDEPLKVNSADIVVSVIKNEGYWNEDLKSKLLPLTGCLIVYAAESSLGEISGFFASLCSTFIAGVNIVDLATSDISFRDIEVETKNIGDDYTSFVTYDLLVYIQYESGQKELFDQQRITMERLDVLDVVKWGTTYSFKAEDYTISKLKNILDGKTGDREYVFEIENINFEKFP